MASSAKSKSHIMYKNAVENYKKKDTKAALQELKMIVLDKKASPVIRVKSYELLAKICIEKNKIQDAIKLYQNALAHIPEGKWADKARICNNLSLLYNSKKEYKESLKYQEMCIDALEKDGNKESMAIALKNLGRIHTLMGEHVKSLKFYQESLKLKRELGDKLGEAQNYEAMAQDNEITENFDKAVENYEKALEIYESIGAHRDVARIRKSLKKIIDWKRDLDEFDKFSKYELNYKDFLK